MTKTQPKSPSPAPEVAAEAPQETREQARARAQQCGQEIDAILAKYGCRIQPYLASEPVGTDGRSAIVTSSFGISPV
jgi:hypothetical protein